MTLGGALGWLVGAIAALTLVVWFKPPDSVSILIGIVLSVIGWYVGTIVDLEGN